MSDNKHKLKDYYDDIFRLRDEGLGSYKIAQALKKEKGVDFRPTSIRRVMNKQSEIPNTFTEILDTKNFDKPDSWTHGWVKTPEGTIFIKNKTSVAEGEYLTLETIRQGFIDELSKYSIKYPVIDHAPIKDKHLLVVDIADLHVGKLAEALETGDEYNSKIAKKRAIKGVEGILKKASGFDIDKILFIIGNDVLHVDNAKNSTTSLTHQDVDGTWHKNYIINNIKL